MAAPESRVCLTAPASSEGVRVAAVWRRPAGAHAAPRTRRSPGRIATAAARTPAGTPTGTAPRRSGRPAHRADRLLPAPISAVFLGLIGGSLGLAGLLPASPSEAPSEATPSRALVVLAADAEALQEAGIGPDRNEDTLRASRSRRTGQGVTAQAAAPPAAVPPPAPVLPGCAGKRAVAGSNGRLRTSALCTVPGTGESLRADAAVAFVQMAAAYEQHFGRAICLTDGYRTLSEQVAVRRIKPRLAARPGTSEHGWGLAVDLACGVQSFRSAQHAWLRQNAGRFGWHQPTWARRGGSKPEPWHWEYIGK